jgi:hypothetical protein
MHPIASNIAGSTEAPPGDAGMHYAFLIKFSSTPRRGSIQKLISNTESAKNRSHVPATSSEALSATGDVAGAWRRFLALSMSAAWAWG